MTTFACRLQDFQLPPEVPIYRLPPAPAPTVSPEDPAITVMTDLRKVRVTEIRPDASVETALQTMIVAKVRLLAVLDAEGLMLGVVTARDLMGEKPMAVTARERIQHKDVKVAHVMTPRSKMDPLNIRDVERARVADIVLVLRESCRQHAIVVEPGAEGEAYYARGIFSITQIGRQLGIEISADDRVQSFAEFEHILAEAERSRASAFDKTAP